MQEKQEEYEIMHLFSFLFRIFADYTCKGGELYLCQVPVPLTFPQKFL